MKMDQQAVGCRWSALVDARHIRISWLLRRAETLAEVEPGRAIWYLNAQGILVESTPSSFKLDRLQEAISRGIIYVLWGHRVERGEWADNLFLTEPKPKS